jgi:TRAP-type C4-dicarboxylate transport system permease small subunit
MAQTDTGGRLIARVAGVVIPSALPHARQAWFDTLAFVIVAAFFVFFSWGTVEIAQPGGSRPGTSA